MNGDRFEVLLRQADQTAGKPPGDLADLPGRVRQLATHRRRRNRIVAAAAVGSLALCIGVIFFTNSARPSERRLTQTGIQADRAARLIMPFLEARTRQDRLALLEAELAKTDPVDQVQDQVEKAAFTLVYQADRMYRKMNLKEPARRDYHRVIELFPHTRGAEIARKRLSEMKSNLNQLGDLS